jgi:IS4 transposase
MAPGTLSLFDLGYIDVERFISAIERGAHFLTRLKSTHNPTVVDVHVGKGTKRAMRGHPLDALLADGRLRADRGVIDLDVLLTSRGKEAVARVVGIEHDDGSEIHWYLTSVDRDLLSGPDVAETYRLRWTIELLFKQLKSGAGLETILAWRQPAVMALIYAKVIALCLARLLELSLREDGNDEIRPRLAMMLVLTRGISLLYTWALMGRGVTLEQLEERLKLIAETVAKARNQRRERERRKREQTLGRAH